MADKIEDATPPKKKKGIVKMLVMGVGLLALVGAGIAGGMYAAGAGLMGGKAAAAEPAGPRLVPKSEEKHAAAAEGGEGGGDEAPAASGGAATPAGKGGDAYASNYYAMDKEFTSNLRDSVHFVQVGVAVSTPYDETVIEHLKNNDIAVRSAILMALGDTTEDQVFTSQGKQQLQKRLVGAINATLQQKEGFGGVGNVYFTSFVVQ